MFRDPFELYTIGSDSGCFALRQISTIKRLLPRLRSLSFMLRFEELVQDVKPDIVAGTTACEEVKASKKFAKILELILLLGNYMNSGSKNGQAFGFEISFLTKVRLDSSRTKAEIVK